MHPLGGAFKSVRTFTLEARDLGEFVDWGGRVLPARPAGDDDLARAQRRDFVGKRLESFGAVIFSGREFARG